MSSTNDPRPHYKVVKYSIITFGCRVNQADSLAIVRDLQAWGAEETTPQDAEPFIRKLLG